MEPSTSKDVFGGNMTSSTYTCTELVAVPKPKNTVMTSTSQELTLFKTPDAPPAKKKRIVLEENKYAEVKFYVQ